MSAFEGKIFDIGHIGRGQRLEKQYVRSSPALGLIMRRPEIDEIVSQFGSVAKHSGEKYIDIVPPIPRERLEELGAALVDLAKRLDDTPPDPTFHIL